MKLPGFRRNAQRHKLHFDRGGKPGKACSSFNPRPKDSRAPFRGKVAQPAEKYLKWRSGGDLLKIHANLLHLCNGNLTQEFQSHMRAVKGYPADAASGAFRMLLKPTAHFLQTLR